MAEMSVSFSKASKRTSIKHNNREKSIDHVDESKSDQNVYLRQESIQSLYEREFGEALENYNAKQKRNDRKIDNYYSHIRNSKKHETQYEFIVQVGERDDYSSQGERELARDRLEAWFKGFEKKNPSLKVYNAAIHMDEATPHMHINLVPVAIGYKNGLEKQASFDKALDNQGEQGRTSKERFKSWRENQIERMEELMHEQGIERKKVGTNSLKNYHEYKDAMRELEKIQGQYNDLSSKYKQIKSDFEHLERIVDNSPKKGQKLLEGKKSLLSDKRSFTPKELKEANQTYSDIVQSRDRLKAENKQLESKNKELKNTISELNEDRQELLSEVGELRAYKDVARKFMNAVNQFLNRHFGMTLPEVAIKENPELKPKKDRTKEKKQEKDLDGPSL